MVNVCCVGAGYVGTPTMAVMAKHCPNDTFTVIDIDERRIAAWNGMTDLPFYEPGLREILEETINKNLFFTTDCAKGIREASIIFIAVNTPTKYYGVGADKAYDLSAWESAARSIARNAHDDKIIVEKSTVPVKTADKVQRILEANRQNKDAKFEVLSNPEFLAEAQAIHNLLEPDRVLVGSMETDSGRAARKKLCDLYANWVPRERIIESNVWSAEMAKLASNAFLAQRLSGVNALSAVCEVTGANIEEVTTILGADHRIGSNYLRPSLGFGGSCLRKDVLGLVYLCERYNLSEVADYWRKIVSLNEYQTDRFSRRILTAMFGSLRRKRVAIMGFSFKKNTSDIRESPAIRVTRFLLDEAATVVVYDPQAHRNEIQTLFPSVTFADSAVEAATGSHALVFCTDWDEFKTLDYEEVFKIMEQPPFIFDGRNYLDHDRLREIGFFVHSVGVPCHLHDTCDN